MWQKRFDAAIMTRLENNKSFHAQFIFEKPTNSAFSVSVIARCIGDNVPGELGCRPK